MLWKTVYIDIINGYNTGERDIYYVMTIMNLVLQWLKIAPLADKKEDTVARALDC